MTQSLDAAMAAFAPILPVGVAYSGGADSTALLMACNLRWPGNVIALHVNHGLQLAAGQFEQHCRDTCAALGIPLRVAHVDARAGSGVSPEDAARRARYEALIDLVKAREGQSAIETISLAQHADDQLETVLLALSRGAGLAGLRGMAANWTLQGVQFSRPLLQVRGTDLRSWLAQRCVTYLEDPTNADVRFLRNRIRRDVTPALLGVFPHLLDTVARSAAHAASAQQLLDEFALADARMLLEDGGLALRLAGLRALARARQANVLRWWLKSVHGAIPSTAQLDELLDQLAASSTRGHRIHIKVATGFAQRKGTKLHWYNPGALQKKN